MDQRPQTLSKSDKAPKCIALAIGSRDPEIYSAVMEMARSHDRFALQLDATEREGEKSAEIEPLE